MKIRSLQLRGFRNYASQDIEFGDGDVHMFVGPNGSGKTNILEAISVLSLSRSCRGHDDETLIRWGEDFYKITAMLQRDDESDATLEIVAQMRPARKKAAFLNDVRVPLARHVGTLPTVIFLPQDLTLFSGQPAGRRRFMDQLLCQMSPDYFVQLTQYQRCIKQRNVLLKRIAEQKASLQDLDTWDAQAAASGSAVTVARLELIETLNVSFSGEVELLGESWPSAEMRMQRHTTERDRDALEKELLSLYAERRQRDVLLQATTVGPHREDWQVYVEDRALHTFASRGQERTAVLALLLLQVAYAELRSGRKPVILLDDVFSELDDTHQQAIVQRFSGYQTILTATHLPPDVSSACVYRVQHGTCSAATD